MLSFHSPPMPQRFLAQQHPSPPSLARSLFFRSRLGAKRELAGNHWSSSGVDESWS